MQLKNLLLSLVIVTTSGLSVAPDASPQGSALDRLRALVDRPTAVYCCKVCSNGKACGDSCISRSKTCQKVVGCACNG